MTEEEWLTSNDPKSMLSFLKDKVSDRKLRLFAVDCCHRIEHLLTDERSRLACALAEQLVDGSLGHDEHRVAHTAAREAKSDLVRVRQQSASNIPEMFTIAATVAHFALGTEPQIEIEAVFAIIAASGIISLNPESGIGDRTKVHSDCVQTLREIVVSPFRPIMPELSWLTSNVVNLARSIYTEKAFDCMPFLADALMDAGCDNADIINHCLSGGPHVRGCWVVDLLLGKG